MQKGNRSFAIFLVIPMVFFCSVTFAGSIHESSCEQTFLPEPIRQVLVKTFSGWRVWGISDLTTEEREYWSKIKNRTDCPGISIGNFQSKLAMAYALSLVPVDPKKRGWRLMVFSKDKTGAYRAEILYQRDDITGTGVLYKVPPGKYTDIEGAESIRLITDGFIYKTYEKGAILFYWKKDRFLELDIDN